VLLIVFGLVSTLAVSVFVLLSNRAAPTPPVAPLNAEELALAHAQIEAMQKIDFAEVPRFVMDPRLPALVDRLLQTPAQWQRLSDIERANALIFAGQAGSRLLAVAQPSEVLRRVEQWFPESLAAARAQDTLWSGRVPLMGPFENWPPTSRMFFALWKCTPQSAWLYPHDSPFTRAHSGNGLPLMPPGARQSSITEYDFGFCVRERNGERLYAETLEAYAREQSRLQQLSVPLIKPLIAIFADTLDRVGCTARGADDCVLLLRQWASLRPADLGLARRLQRLSATVDPGGGLPPLEGRFDPRDAQLAVGQRRFDEGLRRLAFLQSQLRSILAAPQAWPPKALATTLAQMSALHAQQVAPFVQRFAFYDVNAEHNEAISPWRVLFTELRPVAVATQPDAWGQPPRDPAQLARLRPAVLGELRRLNQQDCFLSLPYLRAGGPALVAEFVLASLRSSPAFWPACADFDYEWLRGIAPAAEQARARALDLLPQLAGHRREALLTGLTQSGASCFTPADAPVPDWQQALCRRYLSQPQTPALKQVAGRYTAQSFSAESIAGLAPSARVRGALVQQLADWERCGSRPYAARRWQAAAGGPALVVLDMNIDMETATEEASLGCEGARSRVLLVIKADALQVIRVPGRFGYQYDAGTVDDVSDLDADGRLEIWFSGTFGECDGTAEEASTCSTLVTYMGEVDGDSLSWFRDERTPGG